jgi:hypothetical protein
MNKTQKKIVKTITDNATTTKTRINQINDMSHQDSEEPSYYQHKIKCMCCGLHFIVCSDYLNWPKEGTTAQEKGETPDWDEKAQAYCPECGKQGPMIAWKQPMDTFIFEAVPGESREIKMELVGWQGVRKVAA